MGDKSVDALALFFAAPTGQDGHTPPSLPHPRRIIDAHIGTIDPQQDMDTVNEKKIF